MSPHEDTTVSVADALSPSDEQIIEAIRGKVEERKKAIDDLVKHASEKGSYANRAFWAMVYDFEKCPKTTDRRRLETLGFKIPKEIPSDEAQQEELIDYLADALARLNVFLVGTEPFTAKEVLNKLLFSFEKDNLSCLDEPVCDTYSPDANEIIDFSYAHPNANVVKVARAERLPRPGSFSKAGLASFKET